MGFDSEHLISRDSYRITGPEGIKLIIGRMFESMPDFIKFSPYTVGLDEGPGQSPAVLSDIPKISPDNGSGLIPSVELVNS